MTWVGLIKHYFADNFFFFTFQMDVCRVCGSFLPPLSTMKMGRNGSYYSSNILKCNVCEDGGKMEEIMIPSVYKYLIAELGSVNLSIKLKPASV